jgi:hypothetical protein
MPLLFSYGTLQQDAVQRSLFGRLLRAQPDELLGFERRPFSGNPVHSIVRFTGNAENRVPGTALEVTEAELAITDRYEPPGYSRISTTLASGQTAWVYAEVGNPQTAADLATARS